MKNILITGAGGRIGSVLSKELENEYKLYLVDKAELEKENSYTVDLSSYEGTLNYFKKLGKLDCVIHLAADPRVKAPWKSVLPNNIISTYNVFEATRKVGGKKIIFASTNHVTGMYEDDPKFSNRIYKGKGEPLLSPEDDTRPDSLYGVSKIYGEELGKYYSENFGISVICFRIGTFNEADRPEEERHRATWMSHRDFINLTKNAIESSDIKFGVYYGVSDNDRRIWDISNAKEDLGYDPQDNAEDLWDEN